MNLLIDESFQDIDDLAFDSPIVSSELLEQGLEDLLVE